VTVHVIGASYSALLVLRLAEGREIYVQPSATVTIGGVVTNPLDVQEWFAASAPDGAEATIRSNNEVGIYAVDLVATPIDLGRAETSWEGAP
jgi:hypothetical protein